MNNAVRYVTPCIIVWIY